MLLIIRLQKNEESNLPSFYMGVQHKLSRSSMIRDENFPEFDGV
jgi:hypothetical protein